MRVIIAGGRDYQLDTDDYLWLDSLHEKNSFSAVITGGASGVDTCGHRWAMRNGIETVVIKADWSKHGRAAGPIRNEEMSKHADAVILFKGGRGTASMRRIAEQRGLLIIENPSSVQ